MRELDGAENFSICEPMMRASAYRLAGFLAMVALVLQAFLPGAMAVAETDDADVSHFFCAPSGLVSADTQATVDRLADILDPDSPESPTLSGHCPLCTLVQGALLPEPVCLAEPVLLSKIISDTPYTSRHVQVAQGPPLGSRGPPVSL